jgi:hypothetical protein
MKGAYVSVVAAGRLAITLIALGALTACFGSGGHTKKYTISGNTAGLVGTVVLQNNGGDNLGVSTNGAFTFATKVKKGKSYAVSVLTQPAGQTCVVTNGSGTAMSKVTNVTVTCTTNPTYTIGGNVVGLVGGTTVVLQNNGGNNLSVNANGAFAFTNKVTAGGAYAVTVLTQPAGQTCTVTNGAGHANANVTNVTVTCAATVATTFTIGGNLTGLTSGTVVLQNNGGDNRSVSANGAFTFATPVASGAAYAITVLTQPAGQTCTVTNGAGNANANVTTVTVTCAANPTFSIGGTISGLAASTTVVLRNNGGNDLSVGANGAFAFTTKLAGGANYAVTVFTQPAGQTCAVTNSTGTVAAANVTNVSVNCSATSTLYSIGGTITGLTGAGLKIEDTSANSILPSSSATTFTLPNKVANAFEYDVGISAQPAGQTCVLIKSHGVINSADVTNVDVRCIANVTDPIVGTYTAPAPVPDGYVYITLFADGVYVYGSVENNGPNCGTTNGGNGVEYGVYNYNKATGAFAIKSAVVDTNGGCGVWANGAARYAGTLSIAGSGQLTVLTLALTGGAGTFNLVPVASTSGQIVGSWANAYHKNFAVFLPAGGNALYYMITETQADTAPTSAGQLAGFEYACATVTALTGGTLTADLTATCQAPAPSVNGPVDTNGTSGLSSAGGPVSFTVNVDTLTASPQAFSRIKPN